MAPSKVARQWSADYKQQGNDELAGFWSSIALSLHLKKPILGDGLAFAIAHAETMRTAGLKEIEEEAAILLPALKKLRDAAA